MLQTLTTKPGLLFGSFLFREDLVDEAMLRSRWISHYGEGPSSYTEFNPLFPYYAKEMGPVENLRRFFIVSSGPVDRTHLLSGKLLSLDWEREWAIDHKRMVNVDIGFISLENFILATTKNYSHRIFLGADIFADLTFQFQQGSYKALPWTYPDYLDEKKITFLTRCRAALLSN